jgi:hypothetical protein
MLDGSPRRWLLISRELPVQSEDAAASWYVDHLFLDQDGVPTLVEVKRSTDTRIRREVVGQMLDYAANAVARWSIDRLRVPFDTVTEASERFRVFLGQQDAEEFWARVAVNLAGGRIRMVFVADVVPPELRTVVDFLAGQLRHAEIYAVEVRNYQGIGERALVPRLVSSPKPVPRVSGERQWDESSFFDELNRQHPESVAVAKRLVEWARRTMSDFWFGKGATAGSCVPRVWLRDSRFILFALWTYGVVELQLQHMRHAPFDDEDQRRELIDRLNLIPGIAISRDATGRRPSFKMNLLEPESSRSQFLETMEWAIDRVRMQASA